MEGAKFWLDALNGEENDHPWNIVNLCIELKLLKVYVLIHALFVGYGSKHCGIFIN